MLSDARIYQIGFLTLFLLLGVVTRDWTLHPEIVLTAIVTCVGTQAIAQWVVEARTPAAHPEPPCLPQPPLSALFSPLITALGLSLLLRTDHITTMMLAASCAVLSKFVLRVRGKHIFNPANFGIIAALVLTPDAWMSPGQWGESSWYAMLFLATGGIVLQRVGRWDTTIAFLGTYAGLEAARNFWLGWTWDVWLHRLASGSLLLFALFMITDPRTIPNARIGRILWSIALALLTFGLRNILFLPTAVLWALFILAPFSIFLDWLFPGDRFRWVNLPEPQPEPPPEPQIGAVAPAIDLS